jgi:hypothetical protein
VPLILMGPLESPSDSSWRRRKGGCIWGRIGVGARRARGAAGRELWGRNTALGTRGPAVRPEVALKQTTSPNRNARSGPCNRATRDETWATCSL